LAIILITVFCTFKVPLFNTSRITFLTYSLLFASSLPQFYLFYQGDLSYFKSY